MERRGYTLIELLIVLIFALVVLVWGVALVAAPTWNCYFTEKGVLTQLQRDGMVSGKAQIVKTERNFFRRSMVYVVDEIPPDHFRPNGTIRAGKVCVKFELDSDLLFEYDLKRVATLAQVSE